MFQCSNVVRDRPVCYSARMKHAAALAIAILSITPHTSQAQTAADGPSFIGNELVRPADFREWIFVTSGLGMTYTAPASANPSPSFTNVYVNPSRSEERRVGKECRSR